MEKHKHFLKYLRSQTKEIQLDSLNNSLKLGIIGKRDYKLLLKELGLNVNKNGELSI